MLLNEADFRGVSRFACSRFWDTFDMDGAKVLAIIRLRRTLFEGNTRFCASKFLGNAYFDQASFRAFVDPARRPAKPFSTRWACSPNSRPISGGNAKQRGSHMQRPKASIRAESRRWIGTRWRGSGPTVLTRRESRKSSGSTA
jgi:hypothetical protein